MIRHSLKVNSRPLILSGSKKVDMVSHQHRTACITAILLQPIKVTTVILVGIKTGLPIISALDQMQGNARYDARSSKYKYIFIPFSLDWLSKKRGLSPIGLVCPLLSCWVT